MAQRILHPTDLGLACVAPGHPCCPLRSAGPGSGRQGGKGHGWGVGWGADHADQSAVRPCQEQRRLTAAPHTQRPAGGNLAHRAGFTVTLCLSGSDPLPAAVHPCAESRERIKGLLFASNAPAFPGPGPGPGPGCWHPECVMPSVGGHPGPGASVRQGPAVPGPVMTTVLVCGHSTFPQGDKVSTESPASVKPTRTETAAPQFGGSRAADLPRDTLCDRSLFTGCAA